MKESVKRNLNILCNPEYNNFQLSNETFLFWRKLWVQHGLYLLTYLRTYLLTYLQAYLLTLLTYLLIYLLTPWCRVLLEKLTGLQLVKKFPSFHGTRRFITALTSVRHLSLSWVSPIESIYPHPTSWRSILILSTHLRLGLPSGSFPPVSPPRPRTPPLSSPLRGNTDFTFRKLDNL